MLDYYSILGIDRNSNEAQIKKAYRLCAIKYHPDKHKGDKIYEEKFKTVVEAYTILGDQEKKIEYDLEWDLKFGDSIQDQPKGQTDYTKSTTYKGDSPEEEKFHYNPHKSFYSSQDRFVQETPQFTPRVDHWGNEINEEFEFFILPKRIGKLVSGYTDLRKSDESITGFRAFFRVVGGLGIGIGIGALIVLVFSVENPIWIAIWFGLPTIISGWLFAASNKLRAYQNFIGVNGFAEYECEGSRDNITKSIEVNFNDVTDLLYVSVINKLNFSYSSTGYGFVWFSDNNVICKAEGEHDSKKGDPDKQQYAEYWLHKTAETYWTIYLLDNMEKVLQETGYLTFKTAVYSSGSYEIKPYIRMGIGYIEFLTDKGNVKYKFNDIKQIYSKGTTLYIEHKNFEKVLFFFKSGNRNEIPLTNLLNRAFFFNALHLLVGYKW